MKKIKEIMEEANSSSLVLMDELGSGTDPMEGAAFAMAIIDYLNGKNIKSIITTHYSEVKAYAFNTTGIKSASMEFNVETLSPTYRLLEGIPGESNALIIAGKYGISEQIINTARRAITIPTTIGFCVFLYINPPYSSSTNIKSILLPSFPSLTLSKISLTSLIYCSGCAIAGL